MIGVAVAVLLKGVLGLLLNWFPVGMKLFFDLVEVRHMSFDMIGSQICNIVYPDKELITNLNESQKLFP